VTNHTSWWVNRGAQPQKKGERQMKRVQSVGAALLATNLLVLLGTATASAAPTQLLPEGSKSSPTTSTAIAGEATLEATGGTKVVCKSDASSAEFTSASSGSFSGLLSECKTPMAVTCTSSGSSKGSIAVAGTLDFWRASLSGKVIPAFVYLVNETHIACGVVLLAMKGCVAGEAAPPEVSSEWTVSLLSQSGKGVNEITKVLPSEGKEEIACELETSVSGKFEQSSYVTNELSTGFEHGGKATEVELVCTGCTKALRPTATPRRKNFGKISVGESRRQTVIYENPGPADWEPTGEYRQYRVIGVNGSFSAELGAVTPCNKPIEANKTCELTYEFKPAAKEKYIVIMEATPGAELIALEGTGV
jgi:hypothetical protein